MRPPLSVRTPSTWDARDIGPRFHDSSSAESFPGISQNMKSYSACRIRYVSLLSLSFPVPYRSVSLSLPPSYQIRRFNGTIRRFATGQKAPSHPTRNQNRPQARVYRIRRRDSICCSESHGQSWRKGKLPSVWYGLVQLSAFLPSSTASCNALCDNCAPSHN